MIKDSLLKKFAKSAFEYYNQASPNSVIKRMAEQKYEIEGLKEEIKKLKGELK